MGRETLHIQPEMDANYDNENELSQVSMETDQRFAVVLFRGAAQRRLFYTVSG